MRTILCFIFSLLSASGFSQQKVNTVSVSHYANPELYIKAGVLCMITDKSGKPSKSGGYLSIYNKNGAAFNFSYPANSRWRPVASKQKIIIPVQRKTSVTVVPLKVKYTPVANNNLREKLNELTNLNAASDRLLFKKEGTVKSKTRTAETLIVSKPPVRPLPQIKKILKARPVDRPQSKTTLQEVAVPVSVGLNSNCISTSRPEYYTFYYLKVNNELLYSDVFPVPAYTNEEEGQSLLEQAWLCFVIALKSRYTEKRVDELLNDKDNDLQLGLMHLRDPFIPSSTIVKTYPYTNTADAAKTELKSWLVYDKEKYQGLKIVKIDFSDEQMDTDEAIR